MILRRNKNKRRNNNIHNKKTNNNINNNNNIKKKNNYNNNINKSNNEKYNKSNSKRKNSSSCFNNNRIQKIIIALITVFIYFIAVENLLESKVKLFTNALPPMIRIGAIFSEDQRNSSTELAFKYAIHNINRDKSILPDTTLIYNIQYVPLDNSFHASKTVCSQVKQGVKAIFGPSDPILGAHIHSICDALDIPHLESRIDNDPGNKAFSINLHPSQKYINTAFQDVIDYLNWTKVGILFERNYGLIKLRDLVRLPGLEVYVRQVQPETYSQVLNELKNKDIHNMIIDTKPDNISLLLKGILQLQMNEYKYHYLFTSFDIETLDLEDFKYNFVNLTAFSLVDANDVSVREVLKDMKAFHEQKRHEESLDDDSKKSSIFKINTEPALIYDSVYIFAIGLQTLEQSHTLRLTNISCAEENPWDGGLSLTNYINAVEWKGLTGPIQFKEGQRIQFKLDLIKLRQHSFVKVGEWSPQTRLNITNKSVFFDSGAMNVTLVVITILETPYVMMHYEKNFTGNERFFGFCVDILDRVAHEVGFDYIIDLVPDRKYGAKDPITGEWNGMVAQLMKHKADLAVGSMTINYARESVIDFTKPFMNLGISILFKVPNTPPTRLFSFMNPLAVDIWLYVLAAYGLVSITMYTVARFSPYEWRNPHPCDTQNNIIENQFTMANSFWFTIGTLMQQGSELNPKATSTRIVSAIWWFFTLIIISSYTANLAAFLTVERMITPIENADDLAGQTEISYGTLESGSTMTFFRDSMIETYKKMWRFMENKKPSVFTSTYEEGIERVLEGNYAFLMESTMLDYRVKRNCNLTQIGGLLDTKGYGIATPMGSPWRDKISLAILELQEKGEIQMLYDKWWKNAGETCSRQDKSKESKANALGVDNIGGVFVVLLCGLAVAVIVAIAEFCHNAKKQSFIKNSAFSKIPNSSLYSEMTEEFCFALKCLGSQKRPALKRKCSKCHSNDSNNSNSNDKINLPHHQHQHQHSHQHQLHRHHSHQCQRHRRLSFIHNNDENEREVQQQMNTTELIEGQQEEIQEITRPEGELLTFPPRKLHLSDRILHIDKNISATTASINAPGDAFAGGSGCGDANAGFSQHEILKHPSTIIGRDEQLLNTTDVTGATLSSTKGLYYKDDDDDNDGDDDDGDDDDGDDDDVGASKDLRRGLFMNLSSSLKEGNSYELHNLGHIKMQNLTLPSSSQTTTIATTTTTLSELEKEDQENIHQQQQHYQQQQHHHHYHHPNRFYQHSHLRHHHQQHHSHHPHQYQYTRQYFQSIPPQPPPSAAVATATAAITTAPPTSPTPPPPKQTQQQKGRQQLMTQQRNQNPEGCENEDEIIESAVT